MFSEREVCRVLYEKSKATFLKELKVYQIVSSLAYIDLSVCRMLRCNSVYIFEKGPKRR